MKVSLNWLKKYTRISLSPEELVAKIGTQLGAVEEVIDLRGKYAGIEIVQITEAKSHENADRLNIYKVTNGHEEIQVVSGDQALQIGDKVAWIAPGQTVPNTFGSNEPFVIAAREMRGVMSHGMFASGKELDFNDDNESVLKLDTQAKPGTLLAKVYELEDVIIDIENKMFTHRPDCFGLLGVAREVAGIQGKGFISPAWYLLEKGKFFKPNTEEVSLQITNEIPHLCPVYNAVVIRNITIKKSPLTMQAYLKRIGIRPINNVVDATNYLMYLTGQPLHAFDYDKVAAIDGESTAAITVRLPKKDEKIKLLDGREIEPGENTILICSRKKPIAVGGVMGGAETEVDVKTTSIILESATFDMYSIRRTSMEYGIFTDAVTRYSKGQSSQQAGVILAEAIDLVQTLAGGHLATEYGVERPELGATIETTTFFINDRLGSRLRASQIKTLLENVEMRVTFKGDSLRITPPFWRTDILIAEDVVEEIGRLFDYQKLPMSAPLRAATAVETLSIEDFKKNVGIILATAGNNELQTYSFVSAKLLEKASQDAKSAYRLRNALSPELTFIRTSLLPSLLEKVHPNHKAGEGVFGLFEIGKTHNKYEIEEDELPIEHLGLSYVFSADNKYQSTFEGAAYYQAKYQLTHLLEGLHVKKVGFMPLNETKLEAWHWQNVATLFEPKRAAVVYAHDIIIGVVGEFKANIIRNFKLPAYIAGFELDLQAVHGVANQSTWYEPLLKYPKVERDLCFKVKKDVLYQAIEKLIKEHFTQDQRLQARIAPVDIYERKGSRLYKQITYRLILQHHDHTLTSEAVSKEVKIIAEKAKQAVDAELV